MSDKPEDQDKAREIKTRYDYQSLMKQKKAKEDGKVPWKHVLIGDFLMIFVKLFLLIRHLMNQKLKRRKLKIKLQINPSFKEAVEELGGQLLEVEEGRSKERGADKEKRKTNEEKNAHDENRFNKLLVMM